MAPVNPVPNGTPSNLHEFGTSIYPVQEVVKKAGKVAGKVALKVLKTALTRR